MGAKRVSPATSGADLHRCLEVRHCNCHRYTFMASWGDVVIGEGGGALGDTSVFQADVVAKQAALLWLISHSHKTKRDEGETVNGLTILPAVHLLPKTHQPAGGRNNKLLISAKLICQMELAWIRSHSGVTRNKVVDRIAKENAVKNTKKIRLKLRLGIVDL